MPIKDLQKGEQGLSRAGVIRLGYKLRKCLTCKKNVRATGAGRCPECGNDNFKTIRRGETSYPVEFPTQASHFVLDDAPGVAESIGNSKPTELRIWFPFNDIDQVFPAYHQLWSASSLICRGDGEQITYAINPQSGKPIIRDGLAIEDFKTQKDGEFKRGQFMPCPGMSHDTYSRCADCKPNAMLIVLLRDVPRLAYYQIATSSIHNVRNLTKELTFFKGNVGKLQGIPFILKYELRDISAPSGEGGKRQRVKKYLLSLEVDPEYYERLMMVQYKLAAPERNMMAIEAGEIIDEVAEEIKPVRPAPEVGAIEPPVWMAPNGNDDSEFVTDDWDAFCARVLDGIKYIKTVAHLAEVMDALGLAYDVENEDYLFDTLAVYAKHQADNDLADQEADAILGQLPIK